MLYKLMLRLDDRFIRRRRADRNLRRRRDAGIGCDQNVLIGPALPVVEIKAGDDDDEQSGGDPYTSLSAHGILPDTRRIVSARPPLLSGGAGTILTSRTYARARAMADSGATALTS